MRRGELPPRRGIKDLAQGFNPGLVIKSGCALKVAPEEGAPTGILCNSRHRRQLIGGETLADRGPQLVSPDLLRRACTDEKSRTAPRTGIKTKAEFTSGTAGGSFLPFCLPGFWPPFPLPLSDPAYATAGIIKQTATKAANLRT
jgi:hypothetical protein